MEGGRLGYSGNEIRLNSLWMVVVQSFVNAGKMGMGQMQTRLDISAESGTSARLIRLIKVRPIPKHGRVER